MQINLPPDIPAETLTAFLAAHGLALGQPINGVYPAEPAPTGPSTPASQVRQLMSPTLRAMSTLRDQLGWQPRALHCATHQRRVRGYIVEFVDQRSGVPYTITTYPGRRAREVCHHVAAR